MARSSNKNTTKKFSKPAVAAIIIVAAVVLIGGIKVLKWGRSNAGDSALARVIGDPSAPVKIVEWVDFQCPACAVGASDLKKYLAAFPGKISLEVKFFPLGMHVHSLQATKFALCAADQGKFWPYYETVFERQAKWRDLFDAYPAFDEIAREVGLNEGKLTKCLADDATREAVLSEKDKGQALGVQSTPTYFVNGKMFVGPKPMREEIGRLLGVAVPAAAAELPMSKPVAAE